MFGMGNITTLQLIALYLIISIPAIIGWELGKWLFNHVAIIW